MCSMRKYFGHNQINIGQLNSLSFPVNQLLGFISFMTIWLTCRSNYDPYLGTYSGFVGGDLETFTLLIYFESFSMTLLLLTTYYFSIVASTFISKTVFVSLANPNHLIRLC